MRLVINKKFFTLHKANTITDENENVLFHTKSKYFTLHDATELTDANGNLLATISKKLLSFHYFYTVEMTGGETFHVKEELFHLKDVVDIDELGWKLQGENILNFDFDIVDAQGTLIASSHRKIISLHDIYTVDIFDDRRAAEVAAVIVVLQHINDYRAEADGDAAAAGAASSRHSG